MLFYCCHYPYLLPLDNTGICRTEVNAEIPSQDLKNFIKYFFTEPKPEFGFFPIYSSGVDLVIFYGFLLQASIMLFFIFLAFPPPHRRKIFSPMLVLKKAPFCSIFHRSPWRTVGIILACNFKFLVYPNLRAICT